MSDRIQHYGASGSWYDEPVLDDPTLQRFRAELADGAGVDLGRAALVLGMFASPELDVAAYLRRLDQLAGDADERSLRPADTIASLFQEDGLRGDEDNYDDPRNSLVDEVLDRQLGIPISLAVIAIEVGRRLGITVEGVPFPGHFLIRVRSEGGAVILDPFRGGGAVSDGELLLRLRAVTGRIAALGPAELGVADSAAILARMLQNLKAIYLKNQEFDLALAIQDRLLVVRGDTLIERRDRGLIYARMNRHVEAEVDLAAYLDATPEAGDADAVREILGHVRERRGPAN